MYMRWRDLEVEQRKSLDYKMSVAREAVVSADLASRHRMAIAFSAGKDSTVLADFIRRFLPETWEKVHLIYGDTGVEYPECVKFAEWIRREWNLQDRFHVARPERTDRPGYKYRAQRAIWSHAIKTGTIREVLKPDGKLKSTNALEQLAIRMPGHEDLPKWPAGSRKSYRWCADQYGWPIMGKAWSKLLAKRINIDTFLKFSNSQSSDPKLLSYYQVLRTVKISQACCAILKKQPAGRMQARLKVDCIFKGLMAAESRPRTKNFLSRGYLFEGARKDYLAGDPFFHCQPLAIWTDDDIWEYIHRFNVPYAKLYEMGYRNGSGHFQKIKRNGCMGCATDIQYQNNSMAMLRRTHPKAWFTFMSAGMARELQKLQRIQRGGQLSLLDNFDPEEIMEMQPCYFDSLKNVAMCDDASADNRSDFDPEVE